MRFVVQGLTYPEAVKLKADLLSAGIECGETAGAIAIYPSDEQLSQMTDTCIEHDARPIPGQTSVERLMEQRWLDRS